MLDDADPIEKTPEYLDWKLVIHGYGVTPHEAEFDAPPGSVIKILQNGEWTEHRGQVTVPQGVHMRFLKDEVYWAKRTTRRVRRAQERQAKNERIARAKAKALIGGAQHG